MNKGLLKPLPVLSPSACSATPECPQESLGNLASPHLLTHQLRAQFQPELWLLDSSSGNEACRGRLATWKGREAAVATPVATHAGSTRGVPRVLPRSRAVLDGCRVHRGAIPPRAPPLPRAPQQGTNALGAAARGEGSLPLRAFVCQHLGGATVARHPVLPEPLPGVPHTEGAVDLLYSQESCAIKGP